MREVCATHWLIPAKATLAAHPQEGGDPALLGIVLQVWIPAFAGMSGVGSTLVPAKAVG
jgi:hypothetical protein